MRVLGATRLSRDSDVSTSITRQREAVERYAREHGHNVVAITEDVDVSGAVSPFERPELGPYLNGHAGEWDILVCAKLDRISRSTLDFAGLLEWCRERAKILVCLDPNIDLSTPWGEAMANVLMSFAQLERRMIGARVADSRVKLRSLAWWSGGAVPPGYQVVKHADHAELVPDIAAATAIRDAAKAVIGGASVRQLAGEMGRDNSTLLKVLRNESLRGFVLHGGSPVRGDDGMPVRREPILADDEWHALQVALDRNSRPGAGARTGLASMLRGVLFCGECSRPMYIQRSAGKVRYRHPATSRECRSAYAAGRIENAVEEALLTAAGNQKMLEPIEFPGENHDAELIRVQDALDELDREYENGNVTTVTFGRMAGKLEAKRAELAKLPRVPARKEWRITDTSFAAYWAGLDTEGRRVQLLGQGARVLVSRDAAGQPQYDIDLGKTAEVWFTAENGTDIRFTPENGGK
jgi:site-specific DNA recombinase